MTRIHLTALLVVAAAHVGLSDPELYRRLVESARQQGFNVSTLTATAHTGAR